MHWTDDACDNLLPRTSRTTSAVGKCIVDLPMLAASNICYVDIVFCVDCTFIYQVAVFAVVTLMGNCFVKAPISLPAFLNMFCLSLHLKFLIPISQGGFVKKHSKCLTIMSFTVHLLNSVIDAVTIDIALQAA